MKEFLIFILVIAVLVAMGEGMFQPNAASTNAPVVSGVTIVPRTGNIVQTNTPIPIKVNNVKGMTVTLNASMVNKAEDIETMIHTVTGHGSQSGTIILDGSRGPFVFVEGTDNSIGIQYSNLTILGTNGAIIQNGRIGFVFEGTTELNNILIQNLTMICDEYCILSSNQGGSQTNVVLANNNFRAGQTAISVENGKRWVVQNNQIYTGGTGINLNGGSEFSIEGNQISAQTAIQLNGTLGSNVKGNKIGPADTGILLANFANNNEILNNQMGGIRQFGIQMTTGQLNNHVDGNGIFCSADAPTCQKQSPR